MVYRHVLSAAFPYMISFDTVDEARWLIDKLNHESTSRPAGADGSTGAASFAFTTREPANTVWLSAWARDRILTDFNDAEMWREVVSSRL